MLAGECASWRGVEKLARVHPGLSLFKHRLSIGLRNDTFADAETPDIDFVAKTLGNLLDEVVLVTLRLDVDVGLSPDQSAHIAFDICRFHLAVKHKSHHE